MSVEVINNQSVRSTIMSAFWKRGFAGPPYSLDDVNPRLYQYSAGGSINVVFYDMEIYVKPTDDEYSILMKYIENETKIIPDL